MQSLTCYTVKEFDKRMEGSDNHVAKGKNVADVFLLERLLASRGKSLTEELHGIYPPTP